VHGSGALTRWLLENDLVDEINLLIVPVVVGQGMRLFPVSGPDIALDLADSRAFPKGTTVQVYRPSGRPQYPKSRPTGAATIALIGSLWLRHPASELASASASAQHPRKLSLRRRRLTPSPGGVSRRPGGQQAADDVERKRRRRPTSGLSQTRELTLDPEKAGAARPASFSWSRCSLS
jgi:RibD C-terminal domain